MEEKLPLEKCWADLMRQAQDGDQAAYRLVLRAMLPVIRSFARRRIYDEILVEDVMQDTLLTIHKLRHTYDPSRPLLPWVAAICSARAIDALRRTGRSQRKEVADEAALAAAIDDNAVTMIDAIGVERELARLLDRLPPRQRTILEMVKVREMTLEAAAQESQMSVSAVKSILHRAFTKLREDGNR